MISVIFGNVRIEYPHATYIYEHEGAYHLSNAPKLLHGDESTRIYAMIPICTPCIIQNDDAINQSRFTPVSKKRIRIK